MFDRVIFHIDMDAFFASVEQVNNPRLRGKPVIVTGGTSEAKMWRRTLVIAASYEARAFGIKTGTTIPDAKKLCPHVEIVFGGPDKYADISKKMQAICLQYTDNVEVFSIDECWMDVTDAVKLFGAPLDIAKEIKKKIKDEMGLTCSIGIGPNKVISKLGSKQRKPDGLVQITRENLSEFYETLTVDKLQGIGIGRKISAKLISMNIKTVTELGQASVDVLRARFGIIGHYLKNVGLGINESPVKKYWCDDIVKSVGHSRTLEKDTFDLDVVRSYMLMLCEKTAARLRRYGYCGRTVHFVVRYADFAFESNQKSEKNYIKGGYEIYRSALKIFEKMMPLKKPVRLVGVSISNLIKDTHDAYLFDDMAKRDAVLNAVDEINARYGDFTVKPVSMMIAEKYAITTRCGLTGRYIFKDK